MFKLNHGAIGNLIIILLHFILIGVTGGIWLLVLLIRACMK